MKIYPPDTLVNPNMAHETILPTIEVDEEMIESYEPRTQASIEQEQ